MEQIFGTIISIGDFLKHEETEVKIHAGGKVQPTIKLEKDRKYIIPDYQREIRWSKENVMELIADVSKGRKFLGNVILNEKSIKEFEVIDGQQRMTVILMIMQYIKFRYEAKLDLLDTCELYNENFKLYSELRANNYDLESIGDDVKQSICKSDKLNQLSRFLELWGILKDIDVFKSSSKARAFYDNLKKSQINIIVSSNDTENYSIGYFLDVNLKGVKLDTEDIFKGHLFSLDSSDEIRKLWNDFKGLSKELDEIVKYPLTKLLEHFFYCDIYKKNDFKDLKFNQEFLIDGLDLDGEYHYAGEHIIRTINDRTYMKDAIRNVNSFITFILSVVSVESLSLEFKKYFDGKKIDHDVLVIIHAFINKIIRDKNVVPKMLVMKYFLEVVMNKRGTKADFGRIYGIYTLSIMFTIFESKKNIEKMNNIVMSEDWEGEILKQTRTYFDNSKISNAKIRLSYKILDIAKRAEEQEEYILQMYRAKTLATIYNYFEIKDNRIMLTKGETKNLRNFVSDQKRFSNEHFIVNKSGTYKNKKKLISYPKHIKSYKESLFNFIFIEESKNGSMDNMKIDEKLAFLNTEIDNNPKYVECQYSKMIIGLCNARFNNGIVEDTFIDDFYSMVEEIISAIGVRIKLIENYEGDNDDNK